MWLKILRPLSPPTVLSHTCRALSMHYAIIKTIKNQNHLFPAFYPLRTLLTGRDIRWVTPNKMKNCLLWRAVYYSIICPVMTKKSATDAKLWIAGVRKRGSRKSGWQAGSIYNLGRRMSDKFGAGYTEFWSFLLGLPAWHWQVGVKTQDETQNALFLLKGISKVVSRW